MDRATTAKPTDKQDGCAEAAAMTNADGRSGALLAGGGVLMVLCCAFGPALVGVVAGTAIGGLIGIVVGCLVAVLVAGTLYWRSRRKGTC